jgi:hypothetical protein
MSGGSGKSTECIHLAHLFSDGFHVTVRIRTPAAIEQETKLTYYKDIKPILDNRCVSCHSCGEAPCQLNLQSYEGFRRGGHKVKVYDAARQKAVNPTRMFIDAQTTQQWREKGFFPIAKDVDRSIFLNYLANPKRKSHQNEHAVITQAVNC